MSDQVSEAIGAYWRSMRRKGFLDCQVNQPSRYSDVLDDRVLLTNCKGYVATYHLNSRRITHSKRDARRA